MVIFNGFLYVYQRVIIWQLRLFVQKRYPSKPIQASRASAAPHFWRPLISPKGKVPWKNRRKILMYPLVNIQKAIENGHRHSEFSNQKWWIFPVRYVTNYQRVSKKISGVNAVNGIHSWLRWEWIQRDFFMGYPQPYGYNINGNIFWIQREYKYI